MGAKKGERLLLYDQSINSSFESVDICVRQVDELLLEKLQLSETLIFKIDFMLREMLNNAAEHGNKFSPDKFIDLRIEHEAGKLIFYISDEGEGINPKNLTIDTMEDEIISNRRRGYKTIKKMKFTIIIDDNTVVVSLDLKKGERDEKK